MLVLVPEILVLILVLGSNAFIVILMFAYFVIERLFYKG